MYVVSLSICASSHQSAVMLFPPLLLGYRLAEGLSCMGLLEAVQQHPEVLKRVFVGGGEPLRTEDLLGLFTVHQAPQGGNRRREEDRTIGYWRDWLLEVGGMISLRL